MSTKRDFMWTTYTDDAGNVWSVKINKEVAQDVALDFGGLDATKPELPKRYRMRSVNAQSLSTGNKRKIPVGTVTATAWDETTTTIDLSVIGSAEADTFTIQSYQGEHRLKPHAIVNI